MVECKRISLLKLLGKQFRPEKIARIFVKWLLFPTIPSLVLTDSLVTFRICVATDMECFEDFLFFFGAFSELLR